MTKRENPILVTKPFLPDRQKVMEYAESLWKTQWLTNNGPLVQKLEAKLCDFLNVKNSLVFCNGHMALDSALRSLCLKGEVITTPFTFLSTANAIEMNGLDCVFCDVKPEDGTIDENKIERLITEKTAAILPVHVYGFPCNVDKIAQIASKYNIPVIYDAAHAFGVKINSVGIGNFGDISMFSMHATKVYHTVEGGLLTFSSHTRRKELAARKNFGMIGKEDTAAPGFNAKLSDMHAAVGLANLDVINEQIERRKQIVTRYLNSLKGVKDIELFSWDKPGVTYNYAYFPVLVKNSRRNELCEKLAEDYNVFSRKYFSPLVSDMKYYSEKYGKSDTPEASRIASEVVTLPLYYQLSDADVDYITDAVKEILG